MKRMRLFSLFLVVVLAILSLSYKVHDVSADFGVWTMQKINFDSSGVILGRKAIGDENDTVRTAKIDLKDCDWGQYSTLAASAVQGAMRLVARVTTQNTATDTINFALEKGAGADGSEVYNYRGKAIDMTPGVYNTLTSEGDATGRYFSGYVQIDADARGVDNVYMSPINRLKLCGDISGTTPKVIIELWIVYPKKKP